MTPQEVVDFVVPKLVKQGLKSTRGGAYCSYRSPSGACAIGHLIDDETAAKWDTYSSPDIRSLSNAGLTSDYGYGWMNEHVDFLSDLQLTHDQADPSPKRFVADFLRQIKILCEEYCLKFPEMKESK
jgi:hypothetical protein